jgi:hypothetical protein
MSNKRETEKPQYEDYKKQEIRSEISRHQEAVLKGIDETKEKIRRAIDESRREIPRNAQAFTDYQEQALRASGELAETYLGTQREIIQRFQEGFLPHVENAYEAWNNWTSPRRAAEVYSKTVSNIADNIITSTRVANNTMFANIDACKAIIQRRTDDLRELSRIPVNVAKTFEESSTR